MVQTLLVTYSRFHFDFQSLIGCGRGELILETVTPSGMFVFVISPD